MSVPYSDFSVSVPVRPYETFYMSVAKRGLDVAVVILSMPIVLPLLGLILLATWIEGGAPLYRQRRIGRGGREFRCWKVRTMVPDAERALAGMIAADAELAREWARNQKLSRDPRITRLGRLLRRSSLDELPQLWNVLNGTMSLIGPRPFTPDQQALYADGRRDAGYYRVRPGLSGLWQVSRRNAGSFAERLDYDEEYCHRLSFAFDCRILWRTAAVVVGATGL